MNTYDDYNSRMKFNGDIIITDPCYIINHDNDVPYNPPKIEDFFSVLKTKEIEGKIYNTMPTANDYPDRRLVNESDFSNKTSAKLHLDMLQRLINLKSEIPPIYFTSDTFVEQKNAYDKACNEYSFLPKDDWDRCNCGESMEMLGILNSMVADNFYGDWSCAVFKDNKMDGKHLLGEFCADSGQVGVFLLDEVLKYNPHFDYHINRPWTTTLIKDFDGEVYFKTIKVEDSEYFNTELEVHGEGNVNFCSKQIGL